MDIAQNLCRVYFRNDFDESLETNFFAFVSRGKSNWSMAGALANRTPTDIISTL